MLEEVGKGVVNGVQDVLEAHVHQFHLQLIVEEVHTK